MLQVTSTHAGEKYPDTLYEGNSWADAVEAAHNEISINAEYTTITIKMVPPPKCSETIFITGRLVHCEREKDHRAKSHQYSEGKVKVTWE